MECGAEWRIQSNGHNRAYALTTRTHRVLIMACCITIPGAISSAYAVDDAYAQFNTQSIMQILDDTGAIRNMLDVGRPDTGGTDSQMLEQILDDTGAIRLALGIGDDTGADSGSIFDLFGSIFAAEESDSEKITRVLADTGAIRDALDVGKPASGSEPQILAQVLADTGAIRQELDGRSPVGTSGGIPTLKPVSAAFDGQGGYYALEVTSGIATYAVDDRTYTIVAAFYDGGVQIIDVSDPAAPAPVSAVFDDTDGFEALYRPVHVDVFDHGGSAHAIVSGDSGIQIIDVRDPAVPVPVSAIFDDTDGFEALAGAWRLDVFEKGDRTYAAVAARGDNAVQIMDVSNPAAPVPASAIFDDTGGFEALADPISVAAFNVGIRIYLAVTAYDDSGVQIIDVTDPAAPVPASAIFDDTGGFEALAGASAVEIVNAAGRTYAAVTGREDNGIQIIDVTNPAFPAPASAIFDEKDGFEALASSGDMAVFGAGDGTYIIASSWDNDAVQIIDVTDPTSPGRASSAFHGWWGYEALFEPFNVETFETAGRTYAMVGSATRLNEETYTGVQIIDVTNPAFPSPVSAVFDGSAGPGGFGALDGAHHVHTYEMDGSTYAVVTAYADNGVQIIDVTDPASPVPVSAVYDEKDGFGVLSGPEGLDVFAVGDRVYAIVAANIDDGVQIIDITDPASPVPVSTAIDHIANLPWGFNGLEGATDVEVFWNGGRAYAAVTADWDDSVQIIDVTDPASPQPVSIARNEEGGFEGLNGADGVTVFMSGGRTYAMVTGYSWSLQIIDLTDPASPEPVSVASGGKGGFEALRNAQGMDIFESGARTYAIVTGPDDSGIQIADITDPARPIPVSAVFDGEGGYEALLYPYDVKVYREGDGIYAVVSANYEDGIQLIDVTDPASPVPIDAAFDDAGGFTALARPMYLDFFEMGGRTYAVVASQGERYPDVATDGDGGIQIIDVSAGDMPR